MRSGGMAQLLSEADLKVHTLQVWIGLGLGLGLGLGSPRRT